MTEASCYAPLYIMEGFTGMPTQQNLQTHRGRNIFSFVVALAVVGGGIAIFLSRSPIPFSAPAAPTQTTNQPSAVSQPTSPADKAQLLQAAQTETETPASVQTNTPSDRAALLHAAQTHNDTGASPSLSNEEKAKLLHAVQQ